MTGLRFGGLFGSPPVDDGTRKDLHFVSIPPCAFTTPNPDVDDVLISTTAFRYQTGTVSWFFAPIQVPHGSTITGAIIYGGSGLNSTNFYLYELNLSVGGANTIVSSTVNTYALADQSVADVDNELYCYELVIQLPVAYQSVYGARVDYRI